MQMYFVRNDEINMFNHLNLTSRDFIWAYVIGLAQNCIISIALAMEYLQYCAKPSASKC